MVKQEIKNVDGDPQLSARTGGDDITPPKPFLNKSEVGVSGFMVSTGLGKRLRAQDPDMSSDDGEDQSSQEDEGMLTPFGSGHPFTNIHVAASSSDMKPFRNVIKRYWTEDEVRSNLKGSNGIFL